MPPEKCIVNNRVTRNKKEKKKRKCAYVKLDEMKLQMGKRKNQTKKKKTTTNSLWNVKKRFDLFPCKESHFCVAIWFKIFFLSFSENQIDKTKINKTKKKKSIAKVYLRKEENKGKEIELKNGNDWH